jgi:hypothetical protein
MTTLLARSLLALLAVSPLACVVVDKEQDEPTYSDIPLRALVERADIFVRPSAPDALAEVRVDVRFDGVDRHGADLAVDSALLYESRTFSTGTKLELALPTSVDSYFAFGDDEGASALVPLRNVGSRNRELVDLCGQTFELDVRIAKYGDAGYLESTISSPRVLAEVWCDVEP